MLSITKWRLNENICSGLNDLWSKGVDPSRSKNENTPVYPTTVLCEGSTSSV